MKKLLATMLLAACMVPVNASAQTDEEKAWESYATPGPEHKKMAAETGSWTNDMLFWMEPGGQPTKAASSSEVKMILGGRYQEMNYTGNIMGMEFEGKSIVSFDNATKEYTSTWIDNMGTGMLVLKGKADKGGNVITLTGSIVNPVTGKTAPYREVYTIVDATTRKMEMYDTKDGKEFKSMEIIMKRK